jgi:hypothetical protein
MRADECILGHVKLELTAKMIAFWAIRSGSWYTYARRIEMKNCIFQLTYDDVLQVVHTA